VPPVRCGSQKPNSISSNDHGRLVTRTDPCGTSDVATYEGLGFLAWDPAQLLSPPGEVSVGDLVMPGLVKSLHDLVLGDGQDGCGFESQNEAWYRFLVEPAPYKNIRLVASEVQTSGVDEVVLQQRREFLRSDSLLAIINVTDETDASLKQYG